MNRQGVSQPYEHAVNDLKLKNEELKTNMALMTDELEELRGIIDRMGDDSTGDSVTIKQLRDEIATLKEERAMLDKNVKYFRDEIATLKDQLAEREDKWDQAMQNAKR